MNPYFPGNFGTPQNPFAGGGTPDGMLLQQMAQGFAPVMSMPQRQMRTGFENLPGFSSPGLTGLAMNMFVAPQLQQQMSNFGMLPGGLSGQNVLDQMQVRRFHDQQQEMMSRIAQDYTPQGVTSTLRGMAAMAGAEFDAPQQAAAARLGSMMATASPLLAQMYPSQMDALAGRTGSAVVMAQRMSETNRFRADPVTGRMGFDAGSSEQLARDVFDRLYAPENMDDMRGVRAGDLGDLYGQLTARGMIAGDPRTRFERVSEAANVAGRDPAARMRIRDALAAQGDISNVFDANTGTFDLRNATQDQMDALTSQTDIQTQARSFEADRVSTSLKGYVDVVSSMREIFGDFGRSDAPMAELIQGLEALSQGGLSQVSPGELNRMVRTTSQLAQTSGMTLDAAFAMQQQAAQGLESRGLNRVMSGQMTQGAMGFGQAMTAVGANATPAFGLGSSDELRQLDQNLRVSAAASPMANAFGAVLRAREEMGGFHEGSEAEALSQALMSGQGFYTHNGNMIDLSELDPNRMAGIMSSGSDMTMADARGFITNRRANQEQIFENDLGNLVRDEVQADRVREDLLVNTSRRNAMSFLRGREGFEDRDTRAQVSQNIGEAIDVALTSLSDADRRDPEIRRQAMRDAIAASAPQLSEQEVNLLAADTFNEISRRAESDYGAHGSVENLLTVMNQNTLDRGQRTRMENELEAGIKNDLAGLGGSGGVMQRAIAAIQDAGEGEGEAELGKVLAKAFGGVAAQDIETQMGASFRAVADQQETVRRSMDALMDLDPNDPAQAEKRAAALRDLEEQRASLRTQVTSLRETMETSGLLDQESRLDVTDIQEFRESAQVNRANRADIMMRMRGSAVGDPDRFNELGQEILGLGPLGRRAGDEEAFNEMRAEAIANLGADATDADREEALSAVESAIESGNLSTAQENAVIRARRRRIDTRPTSREVDKYLRARGITGDQAQDRNVRAAATEIVSTQKRFLQSGVDPADFAGVEVSDADIAKFVMEAGISEDVMAGMSAEDLAGLRGDIADTIREERVSNADLVTTASTMEGARNQADRYALFQQQGVASTLRASEREFMNRTRTLANDAVQDPNFFLKAGGRGLAATRVLRGSMEELSRLSMAFAGGDMARLRSGSIDVDSDLVRERLGDLATDRADEIFKNGQLLAEFNVGDLEGKSRAEILADKDLSTTLGNMILNKDIQGINESIEDSATFLEQVITTDGMAFTVEPSAAIKRAMNLGGVGDDPVGAELQTARRAQAFENARLTLGVRGSAADSLALSKGVKTSFGDSDAEKISELGEAMMALSGLDADAVSGGEALLRQRDAERSFSGSVREQLEKAGVKDAGAVAADMKDLKGQELADALMEKGVSKSMAAVLAGRSETLAAGSENLEDAREAFFGGDLTQEQKDTRLNQLDLVRDNAERLQQKEKELAGLDKAGALRTLTDTFLGADAVGDFENIARSAQGFASGGTGLDLVNQINRASQTVKSLAGGFDSDKFDEAKRAVLDGDGDVAELLGVSDAEAAAFKRGIRTLDQTGMLSVLDEEGTADRATAIQKQLTALRDSGVSLDDVRQRSVEMTGKLTIEGKLGSLSATGEER